MSERSAHSPCLRNVGCIFTRNHTGHCSTFSPSSVPVPRPSEPLPTTTQEECDAKVAAAHTEISALCHGKRWLMSIPVRPEADSDTIICDALRALKNRVKILEAELARQSPSVPTAIQEQRDAERWRFVLPRLVIRQERAMSGAVHPFLDVEIGQGRLPDSVAKPDTYTQRGEDVCKAIDAARVQGESSQC